MIGLNRLDAHQPLTSVKLPFSGHTSIAQSFSVSTNNLNIVSLCLRNPSRELAPLEFSLHEATSSAVSIRSINFSGGNIDNQDCTRFQFDPVTDSAGKTYVAQVKRLASETEYPLIDLYVEAYDGKNYRSGDAYLDQVPTGYDLHFKTNYYQPLSVAVRESATQFVQRLGQDPSFFIFYVLVLAYLLSRLFKKNHEK